VQSVSGGLFGGDRVTQRVVIGDGGEAVIRMPSATVVHHRRDKPASSYTVTLRTAHKARLLYLPRPLILLPGSEVVQATEIELGRDSEVLLQDSFLMHDPQGVASVARALDSRLTIRTASGRLVAVDRMRVTDEVLAAATPGVVGGYRAFGTVWVLRPTEREVYRRFKAAAALVPTKASACYLAMSPLRAESGVMVRVAARDGGDLDVALTMIRANWFREKRASVN
jgi:urease accessory protein